MKFLCKRFIFCLNECQSIHLLECKFSRVNLEYLRVPSFLSKQERLYMGIHGRFLSETFIWLNNLSSLHQAKCQLLSCATPRTIANQAPLSMEFFKQEYWSGFTFPSPGDLSNPGLNLDILYCRQILEQVNINTLRSGMLLSWEEVQNFY